MTEDALKAFILSYAMRKDREKYSSITNIFQNKLSSQIRSFTVMSTNSARLKTARMETGITEQHSL
jgi:hypothetical protein